MKYIFRLLIVLFITYTVYNLYFKRTTSSFTYDIALKNETIMIKHTSSIIWGISLLPRGMLNIGGRDDAGIEKLELITENKKVVFEDNYDPIIVNRFNQKLYISTYSYAENPTFKFYVYDKNNWRRIKYNEFPKEISLKNTKEYFDTRYPEKFSFDPKSISSRNSTNGRLWYTLSTGKQSYNHRDNSLNDELFFENYINKYFN